MRAIYKFTPRLQAGITYRGKTKTKLSGPTDFIASNGNLLDSATKSIGIDALAQIQGEIYYQFTSKFSDGIDVVWTHWSRIKSYTVTWDKVPELLQIEGKTSETFIRNRKNTTLLKFGASYNLSKKVVLRGEFYYHLSSVINKDFDMVWPDANKIAIFTDVGIEFSKHLNLALAYINFWSSKEAEFCQ